MARKRQPKPIQWSDIHADGGAIIGWFRLDGSMICVKSLSGVEEWTHLGVHRKDPEPLARMVLSTMKGNG